VQRSIKRNACGTLSLCKFLWGAWHRSGRSAWDGREMLYTFAICLITITCFRVRKSSPAKRRAVCIWSSLAWMQYPYDQITLHTAVDARLCKIRDTQPACCSPAPSLPVSQPCPAVVGLSRPDIFRRLSRITYLSSTC